MKILEQPFAVTLLGDTQANLQLLFEWLGTASRFESVMWTVDDLETNQDPNELDIGATTSTAGLSKLLVSQIIELDLIGRCDERVEWRIVVRDGTAWRDATGRRVGGSVRGAARRRLRLDVVRKSQRGGYFRGT